MPVQAQYQGAFLLEPFDTPSFLSGAQARLLPPRAWFGPRNEGDICFWSGGPTVPIQYARMPDAYAAKRYLAAKAFIDKTASGSWDGDTEAGLCCSPSTKRI